MDKHLFETLKQELETQGADAAIDSLCNVLREQRDYPNLFYAMLMKKRHELGISPIPTSPAQQIPKEFHPQYEDAIREAAQTVGQMCLDAGNIPQAWSFYQLLGETGPVAEALEKYQPEEEEDAEPLVGIAYHQGVNPKRGFDLILDRWGICSAITILSSQEFQWGVESRDYCIKRVIQTLYHELRERLIHDITQSESAPDPKTPVKDLIQGRPYLFAGDIFHVDVSHLGAAVQMSINLPLCEEVHMARELCEYGKRLSKQFLYRSEPPFDDMYNDYGIYLSVLTGENVEEGLAHFRKKIEDNPPEEYGTFSAEVLVNLLLRLDRPEEALEVARTYLTDAQDRPLTCPNIVELCERTKNFQTLAEVSQEKDNQVHYLAGLIGSRSGKG